MAEITTLFEMVALFEGDVIEIVGAVVSGALGVGVGT